PCTTLFRSSGAACSPPVSPITAAIMATIAPLAIMSPTTAAAILSFAQVKEPTTDPANDADDTATVAWPNAAALTDAMSPTEGAAAAELANPADNVASVK